MCEVLLSKSSDCKLCMFCVALVLQYKVNNSGDCTGFVECSVNILHWDQMCECVHSEPIFLNVLCVNEEASHTSIK